MDYQDFFLGLVCLTAGIFALVKGIRQPKNDEPESNVMITKSNNYGIYLGSAIGVIAGIYLIINSFGT